MGTIKRKRFFNSKKRKRKTIKAEEQGMKKLKFDNKNSNLGNNISTSKNSINEPKNSTSKIKHKTDSDLKVKNRKSKKTDQKMPVKKKSEFEKQSNKKTSYGTQQIQHRRKRIAKKLDTVPLITTESLLKRDEAVSKNESLADNDHQKNISSEQEQKIGINQSEMTDSDKNLLKRDIENKLPYTKIQKTADTLQKLTEQQELKSKRPSLTIKKLKNNMDGRDKNNSETKKSKTQGISIEHLKSFEKVQKRVEKNTEKNTEKKTENPIEKNTEKKTENPIEKNTEKKTENPIEKNTEKKTPTLAEKKTMTSVARKTTQTESDENRPSIDVKTETENVGESQSNIKDAKKNRNKFADFVSGDVIAGATLEQQKNDDILSDSNVSSLKTAESSDGGVSDQNTKKNSLDDYDKHIDLEDQNYPENYIEIIESLNQNVELKDLSNVERRAILVRICDLRFNSIMDKRFSDAKTNGNLKNQLWKEIYSQINLNVSLIKTLFNNFKASYRLKCHTMQKTGKIGEWSMQTIVERKAPNLIHRLEKLKEEYEKKNKTDEQKQEKVKKTNQTVGILMDDKKISKNNQTHRAPTTNQIKNEGDLTTVLTAFGNNKVDKPKDKEKKNKEPQDKEQKNKESKNKEQKNKESKNKEPQNKEQKDKESNFKEPQNKEPKDKEQKDKESNFKEPQNKEQKDKEQKEKKQKQTEQSQKMYYEMAESDDFSEASSSSIKRRKKRQNQLVISKISLKTFENDQTILKLINERDALLKKLLKNTDDISMELALEISKKEEQIEKMMKSDAHRNVVIRNIRSGLRS